MFQSLFLDDGDARFRGHGCLVYATSRASSIRGA